MRKADHIPEAELLSAAQMMEMGIPPTTLGAVLGVRMDALMDEGEWQGYLTTILEQSKAHG